MGFMMKYSSLSVILIYFTWSLFISVNGVIDVLGDVHDENFTTRIHLEQLVVSDNESVQYVPVSERELHEDEIPWPG